MKTPTLQTINEFTARVECEMTATERAAWMQIDETTRKGIAWAAWMAIHNAGVAA